MAEGGILGELHRKRILSSSLIVASNGGRHEYFHSYPTRLGDRVVGFRCGHAGVGRGLVVASRNLGSGFRGERWRGRRCHGAFDHRRSEQTHVHERRPVLNFDLTETSNPKGLDLIIEQDGSKVAVPGIYQLEGNQLTVCYTVPGQARPTQFSTRAGDMRLLAVLKRKP